MDRLDEINARCEAATPGPWGTPENPLKQIMETGYNAGFIAHAREDIPYLLAENARLRDEAEYFRGKSNDLLKENIEYSKDNAHLREELSNVTAERDAAITGIPHICRTCKYKLDGVNGCFLQIDSCKDENGRPGWRWSGPQPKAGGET